MNRKYIPINLFSLKDRGTREGSVERIQDYDVYVMPEKKYSIEQLEEIDDTIRVVEEIEKAIKECGYKMMNSPYELEFYDENYNYLEDGEEPRIELTCNPGLLVDEGEYETFKKNVSVLKDGLCEHVAFSEYGFHLMLDYASIQYKFPVKFAKTLKCDHWEELKEIGIDVVNDYIYGIVDIQKMCEELKRRGINIEIQTFNRYDLLLKGVRESRGSVWSEPVIPPPLVDIDSKSYIDNLQNTKLDGNMIVSIPFSKFLRDEHINVEEYKRKRGL